MVVAEEECGFAECDGGSEFDHDAFVGRCAVEDCEYGVGIGDVLDVGLSDSICPAWVQVPLLIVPFKGLPDL